MSQPGRGRHPPARVDKTVVARRRMRSTGRSASRTLVVCALLGAVLSIALLGRAVLATDRPVPVRVEKIRAEIQFPPDHLGRCERFEWDNETGLMSPKGVAECAYTQARRAPQLDGIKSFFSSR